jgi:hypothetical protein
MSKYSPEDDGKTVGGRVVVYLHQPRVTTRVGGERGTGEASSAQAGSAGTDTSEEARNLLSKSRAAPEGGSGDASSPRRPSANGAGHSGGAGAPSEPGPGPDGERPARPASLPLPPLHPLMKIEVAKAQAAGLKAAAEKGAPFCEACDQVRRERAAAAAAR